MTAEEKAKDLVTSIYYKLPNNGSNTGINSIPSRWEEAKMCALLTVNEIINTIEYSSQADELSKILYWEKVEQEINKL
jgi:hypothetical protein